MRIPIFLVTLSTVILVLQLPIGVHSEDIVVASTPTPTPTPSPTPSLNCTMASNGSVVCNGIYYNKANVLPHEDLDEALSSRFWLDVLISVFLVLTAGMMSGLTMGLMSLSLMDLQILANAGDAAERKQAKRIIPLVERHHLLLVTLLLANALAAEALPLSLNRLVNEFWAIIISVTAVLMFGEVIPQAICTRYGLKIGSALVPVVLLIRAILFPIAYPIARLLDWLLGEEHTTFHRRAELKELVKIYQVHNKLLNDEMLIIQGALDMQEKTVRNAMTPLEKVRMLSILDVLDQKTMDWVSDSGHSRFPVYAESRHNILGLVLIKTLIKLNPADATDVGSLQLFKIPTVTPDMPLYDLLNMMQSQRVHMAIVSEGNRHVIGIITLEDVFEQLIQEEIYDETDVSTKKEARVLLQMANTFIANAKERANQRREFLKELKHPTSSVGQSQLARTLMGRHHHAHGLMRSSSDSSLESKFKKSKSEGSLLNTESTLVITPDSNSSSSRDYGTINAASDDLQPLQVDRAMVAQNVDELWFDDDTPNEKRILVLDDKKDEGEETYEQDADQDQDGGDGDFVYDDVFEDSATQPLLDNQK